MHICGRFHQFILAHIGTARRLTWVIDRAGLLDRHFQSRTCLHKQGHFGRWCGWSLSYYACKPTSIGTKNTQIILLLMFLIGYPGEIFEKTRSECFNCRFFGLVDGKSWKNKYVPAARESSRLLIRHSGWIFMRLRPRLILMRAHQHAIYLADGAAGSWPVQHASLA